MDESLRGTYIVCAVLVSPSAVRRLRTTMRAMLTGGESRLHMAKENETKKKRILEGVVAMNVEALIVSTSDRGESQRLSRDRCLAALAKILVRMEVSRLVVESCDQDKQDLQVIGDTLAQLGALKSLVVEHRRPQDEPLLWAADIVAWAQGKSGRHWKRSLEKMSVRETLI
jgi:hypothetical protein